MWIKLFKITLGKKYFFRNFWLDNKQNRRKIIKGKVKDICIKCMESNGSSINFWIKVSKAKEVLLKSAVLSIVNNRSANRN